MIIRCEEGTCFFFESPLEVGPLKLDPVRFETYCRGKTIPLTLSEFKLLALLSSKPGHVFSREKLLKTLSGGSYICDHNLDVRINCIRKKLNGDRMLIITVKGIGYKVNDRFEC